MSEASCPKNPKHVRTKGKDGVWRCQQCRLEKSGKIAKPEKHAAGAKRAWKKRVDAISAPLHLPQLVPHPAPPPPCARGCPRATEKVRLAPAGARGRAGRLRAPHRRDRRDAAAPAEAHEERERRRGRREAVGVIVVGQQQRPDGRAVLGRLSFHMPIRTTTGLNSREHFAVRATRVRRERQATRLYWRKAMADAHPALKPDASLWVTLTRISPGNPADLDNVVGGLKAVRDQIAEQLGRNDNDPKITWQYIQQRGPWGVQVLIEVL